MKRKFMAILLGISICANITACSKKEDTNSDITTESTKTSQINIESVKSKSVGEVDTFIGLGRNISIEGHGATIENNKIIITSAGTYSISGKLDDGQIIVNAGDEDEVYIVLNGVDITCQNSAPIYVMSAKNAIIALAEGTENNITDGENYVFEDEATDEPNAAIFSKDDLIFIGEGSLTVNANYNNGIASKDDLEIQGGNIKVNSVHDGIRGKDSVNITNGNITVNATGDGMKSNNIEDETKGYVYIDGGTINITAGEDGIQAETQALIKDGDITISSGGGSENSSKSEEGIWGNWGMPDKNMGDMKPGEGMKQDMRMEPSEGMKPGRDINPDVSTNPDTSPEASTDTTTTEESTSAKAIKAGTNIIIEGGNINIDSSDDSIHSNDNLIISGGTMNLSSGDDGIHSDSNLTIDGGVINITKSYEGIESEVITINDGEIHVNASDDGINSAGGSDGSSTNGRPGQNNFSGSSDGKININGGYIFVDASGDGIDSNGSIYMTNGTVIVNGPENNGNGALDYDRDFELSGGTLITAGIAGMVQTPGQNSTQNTISLNLASQEANTIVHIKSESGEDIITFAPSKAYESIIVSTPNIKTNETYYAYIGGSSSGTATDGLYSGGTYSGGNEVNSVTISSVITSIIQDGASTGGSMGGPGGKRDQGGFRGSGGSAGEDRGNLGEPPSDMPVNR